MGTRIQMSAWLTGLVLFVGVAFGASAAMAIPMDEVGFWLMDSDGDGKVSLWVDNFYTGDYSLQYKTLSNDSWSTLSLIGDQNKAEIDSLAVENGRELFYFSLFNGSERSTAGTVTFSGGDGAYSTVFIQWLEPTYSMTLGSTDTDKVSPVPIPSALLLFIPGVVGLLGVRRRKNGIVAA